MYKVKTIFNWINRFILIIKEKISLLNFVHKFVKQINQIRTLLILYKLLLK